MEGIWSESPSPLLKKPASPSLRTSKYPCVHVGRDSWRFLVSCVMYTLPETNISLSSQQFSLFPRDIRYMYGTFWKYGKSLNKSYITWVISGWKKIQETHLLEHQLHKYHETPPALRLGRETIRSNVPWSCGKFLVCKPGLPSPEIPRPRLPPGSRQKVMTVKYQKTPWNEDVYLPLGGGFNQPIWKILISQIGSSSPSFGVKMKNIWVATTQLYIYLHFGLVFNGQIW